MTEEKYLVVYEYKGEEIRLVIDIQRTGEILSKVLVGGNSVNGELSSENICKHIFSEMEICERFITGEGYQRPKQRKFGLFTVYCGCLIDLDVNVDYAYNEIWYMSAGMMILSRPLNEAIDSIKNGIVDRKRWIDEAHPEDWTDEEQVEVENHNAENRMLYPELFLDNDVCSDFFKTFSDRNATLMNGNYYVIDEYKGERIIISVEIFGDEIVGGRAWVGTLGDLQPRGVSFYDLNSIVDVVLLRLMIARNSIDENRHDTYQPPLNLLHLCTFFHDNLIDIEIILNYRKKRARFFSRHSYSIEQKPFSDALSSIINEIKFQKKEIAEEYNDNSLKGILKRLERTKQQKIDRKKYPELCPKENTKIGFWKTIRAGIIASKYGKECGIEYLEGKGQYKK